ncbi:MAG TPA: hypothetical protein VFX03_16710, partial [Thermomicrobiales bacterium]|nr:hypothetical protein [Thermomicrobiales bacterium]
MPIATIGEDFAVNTTATSRDWTLPVLGPGPTPSLIALTDGRFVAAWPSIDSDTPFASSTVRGRIFNADGSPAGDDFVLNSTTGGKQIDPSLAALANGRFVATWESDETSDGSGTCIRGRVFNADGTPAGDDFILNSTVIGNQSDPSVAALADGRFVVTWESGDAGDGSSGPCIRGRVFNADGTPAGDDFILNSTATGTQFSPTVTALADG